MASPDTAKRTHRHDVFHIAAVVLLVLAGAVTLGGWDLLSSFVSKEVQGYLIGGLIGFCACLLGLGIYSAVGSHHVHRSLIDETHRVRAAQEKAAEMPE